MTVQIWGEPHRTLAAQLMYEAGMRIQECLRLRVQDLDFEQNQILIRHGEGAKDRRTMLPASLNWTNKETAEQGRFHMDESLLQRAVPELLGHSDLKTTQIYTHVLNQGPHSASKAPRICSGLRNQTRQKWVGRRNLFRGSKGR